MKESSMKLWFKAKRYGWGWYPVSWQGWLVLGVYLGGLVVNFVRIDGTSLSIGDTLVRFVPEALILTGILIGVCWVTGEPPAWHWGNKTPPPKTVVTRTAAVRKKAKKRR